MPPSTRALVRVAIVPVTLIGLAACQPGAAFGAPLPSAPVSKAAAGSVSALPPLDHGGTAYAEATRQTPLPTLPVMPTLTEFSAGPGRSDVVMPAVAVLDAVRSSDAVGYPAAIDSLAAAVAAATGLDSAQLAAAWQAAGVARMTALAAALSQLGVSYRYASSSPGGAFDCSGLVSWAWAQAGLDLPHQSRSIIDTLDHVPLSDVRPGDVLWYPGHVSLALGIGDAFVDAPNRGNSVRIVSHHSRSAARRLVVGVTQ